jgi:aldehyde dehydrogenase (NAD+)
LINASLPFGGVNHSGHGSYHGFFGFKAFSHERRVLKQAPFSMVKLMYPPYSPFVRRIVSTTMKLFI